MSLHESSLSPASARELEAQTRQMHRSARLRLGTEYLAIAVVFCTFVFYFFNFPTPRMQTGSALIMLACLFVGYQLHRRASLIHIPENTSAYSWVEHQRAHWIRQRDALQSVWYWYVAPLVPGVMVFRWGVETEMAADAGSPFVTGVFANGLIAGIFIAVVLINLYSARQIQKRIDRL